MSFLYLTHLSLTLGSKWQRMTPYQTRILTRNFEDKPFLGKGGRSELAKSLNISQQSVRSWFYRMRQKKKEEDVLCTGEYSVLKNEF